jgi:hypothetical protein
MVTWAYYGLIEYSISSKNNATNEHIDIILNIIKK